MTRCLRGLILAALCACATARADAPVVLLRSDTTAAFFAANGGRYELLLEPWRAFFARAGIAARELSAAELAGAGARGVLVLPSSVALGAEERDAIRARLAAGWGVLGTWAVGVRDGRANWSGYGFIEEIFGARVEAQVPGPSEDRFLLPYGETPLTTRLTAGKRIYLLPTPEPLLRVRARNAAARFANYDREATQPAALLPGVAFDERDGARRAYLGFVETAWSGAQADIDRLLLGTLDWLAGRPAVLKGAWPWPHAAALLLEMDTEDKFENSLRFAAELERHGLRGTFYSLTSEAARFPEVVQRLAARHEIGYHADVHDGFAGLPAARQEARLKGMIGQLAKLLPEPSRATGFRAPLEQYDDTTERLLRANGLRYHAASPDARADALPGFSTAEKGVASDQALVVLPRTWIDDIALLRAGRLDPAGTERMLLASLADTLAMRGFGLLSVHTQSYYAGGALEKAMPRLLAALERERGRVWAAPGGEAIARWWRERAAVNVSSVAEAGALRITLDAARAVRGLQLIVIPPPAARPRLASGAPLARLEKLDDYRWAVVFEELPKGRTALAVAF